MKVQELLTSIKNKEFNLEKRLEVKKYLPMEAKKRIAEGIILDCVSEENGVIKVDSVERYMSYVRYMIIMHTNLEYSDSDYDALCSTEYQDNTLLNAIMACFDSDAKECSRILNLMTDDYLQQASIEASVARLFYTIGQSIDNLAEKLGDKMTDFNLESLLSELDLKTISELLTQYTKQ